MRFEAPDPSMIRWKTLRFTVQFVRETPWLSGHGASAVHTWTGIFHGRLKRALRDRTCVALGKCQRACHAGASDCLYGSVFEHPPVGKAPVPIILRWTNPPADGLVFQDQEVSSFELVFMGPAFGAIGPLIQALTEFGDAGPEWKPTLRLLQVDVGLPHDLTRTYLTLDDFHAADAPEQVAIHFLTPWVGPERTPDFADFWSAVHRRIFSTLRPAFAPNLPIGPDLRSALRGVDMLYHDMSPGIPYGAHVTHEHRMQGWVGTMVIAGNLTPFWPLMSAAEHLHVGQKAHYGVGQFALEPMERG